MMSGGSRAPATLRSSRAQQVGCRASPALNPHPNEVVRGTGSTGEATAGTRRKAGVVKRRVITGLVIVVVVA